MKTSQQLFLKRLKLAIFYTSTAIIFYLLVLCFLFPILIYRQIIKLFVHVTDPACQEILSGIGALLTGSQPYKKPPLVLIPYMFLDGHVNLSEIIKTVDKNLIIPNVYPELCQKIVPKLGYHFWKPVENFNLENHIRYFNPDSPNNPVSRSTVRNNYGKTLSKLPFNNQHSPWEIVIVPNVFDPDNSEIKSAVLFRFHHALFDGQSSMKFVQKLSAHPWSYVSSKTMATKRTNDIWKALQLLTTGPYEGLKYLVSFLADESEFLDNVFKTKELDWKVPKEITERIPIANIKEITKRHNVGMSSVITTSVVVGAANFMRKKCSMGFSKLPQKFILHMVLPLPGHPDNKLINWRTMVRLPITTNKTQDPVQFAQKMHAKYLDLAQSIVHMANYLTCALLGLLPVPFRPNMANTDIRQTVMLTNFPGPKKMVNVFGANMMDWTTLAGGSMGTAFVATSQSLYDKFNVEVGSLSTVYENEYDVNFMHNSVKNVLNVMRGGAVIK